ncbi:hypothetical protein [Porphyromonas crevioricanis]|uniref:Uncharacterized protein n=1 Tax=Porphyromonas crevioricanis TaxID=393921 RepID=A0AB34PEC8_9PORP|nr:hypothetical protein [Porphyromonas crevioricanis]KGN93742.1 hypothetical protein HQ38_08155 [Porphyromonas crevioricanis]
MRHLYNINFAIPREQSKELEAHLSKTTLPQLRAAFAEVELYAYRLTDPIYDENVCNCSLQFIFPDRETKEQVMASSTLAESIKAISEVFDNRLLSFDSLLEEIQPETID